MATIPTQSSFPSQPVNPWDIRAQHDALERRVAVLEEKAQRCPHCQHPMLNGPQLIAEFLDERLANRN